MLLTVYCVRRDLSEVTFSLQVDADFELHNFRALCELESGIPAAESQVRRAASGASLRSRASRLGAARLPCAADGESGVEGAGSPCPARPRIREGAGTGGCPHARRAGGGGARGEAAGGARGLGLGGPPPLLALGPLPP